MDNQLKNYNNFEIMPATKEETELIDDKLEECINSKVPFTQENPIIYKNYVIKDADGAIIAGIKADIYYWRILFIELLFVDEKYRGKQLGSLLINRVEQVAKAMGCTLAHTDTFDFQAKDFYLKQAYQIFGVLENCPPGHKRYYLKKDL